MELQRHLGVTYKCAWRMANKIRGLMKDDTGMLGGVVEVDETYIGGKHKRSDKFDKKDAVMGMVERNGRIKTKKVPSRQTHIVLNTIKDNVSTDATVMSDEYSAYKKLPNFGYDSKRVKHGKGTYVRGNVHTNTIEGFWGQFKRSVKGTYHSISSQHLQKYLDEFSFRYSYRFSPVPLFQIMISRV